MPEISKKTTAILEFIDYIIGVFYEEPFDNIDTIDIFKISILKTNFFPSFTEPITSKLVVRTITLFYLTSGCPTKDFIGLHCCIIE